MNRKEIHIITPRFDSFGLRNTKSDITDVIQCGNVRITLNQNYLKVLQLFSCNMIHFDVQTKLMTS